MNIEARKISIIQQILSIDNASFVKELENVLAQLLPKYHPSSDNNNDILSSPKSKKAIPPLTEETSALLLKINEGLPHPIQERYNDLSLKTIQETLTEEEHQELLTLVPIVEAQTVKRLKYLVQLAQLWNMSVDEVMEKLEITYPETIPETMEVTRKESLKFLTQQAQELNLGY